MTSNKKQPVMEVDPDGTQTWFLDGLAHREDGPAIIYSDGDEAWCLHGQLHREDGPAIDYRKFKRWYLYDQLHREDGPAIDDPDDTKRWYWHGKLLDCHTQEEFESLMRLKAFW